jgi:hypothetical protein
MALLHEYAERFLPEILEVSKLSHCEIGVAMRSFFQLCPAAIAHELGVKRSTVYSHRRAAFMKLDVEGPAELTFACAVALFERLHTHAPGDSSTRICAGCQSLRELVTGTSNQNDSQ